MFDRRYPQLVRPENAPREVQRCDLVAVRAAENRCIGVRAAYNVEQGFWHFYRGDVENGCFTLHHSERRIPDPDEVVSAINRVINRGMRDKMREVDGSEADAEKQREEVRGQRMEDDRPRVLEAIRRKHEGRGMHKRFVKSAVVNGLKGSKA